MSLMPTNIRQIVEQIVADEGFHLYDMEIPDGRRRVLRIFITKDRATIGGTQTSACLDCDAPSATSGGVTLGDCAKISRRISSVLDNDMEIEGGAFVLEVSSPGINRQLRLPEHFVQAVGERVRVSVCEPDNSKQVVFGQIRACSGDQLEFVNEESKEVVTIPLSQIDDARVDFLFK